MQDALDDLAGIAQNLGPLGAALVQARETARRGKREPTLPRIGAVAAQTLQAFETLSSIIASIRTLETELREVS